MQGLTGPPGDVGPEGVIGKKVSIPPFFCFLKLLFYIYTSAFSPFAKPNAYQVDSAFQSGFN